MKVFFKVLDWPELIAVLGKRELALSFPGETIGDLLEALLVQYGPPLARLLRDSQGKMNKTVQFIVSGKLSEQEYQSVILKEGDRVALVVQLEGG
jgi:hypothetical protein